MNLTSDSHILCTIESDILEFSSQPIQQSYLPNSICKDHLALVNAEAEICSLQATKVVVSTDHELEDFMSPIFSVPKKDGNVRRILNLRS